MSAKLSWSGLDELKEALRTLPDDLTGEAKRIVEATANGAAVDVRAEYGQHARTGSLQRGVIVTHYDRGRFSAGAIVKNTAPHAWLFDNGSQARHYTEESGKPHPTGKMWGRSAPTHVFVRTMIRARRRMWGQFVDLLERHGLRVDGKIAA